MDPDDLAALAVADAGRDGSEWRLAGRLDGGSQSGAWRLEAGDGSTAVLKLALTTHWAAQVERASRAVAIARTAGYPTPAWLSTGTVAGGLGYQIQQLVPGRTVERIGLAQARALIEVLESATGIDPDPDRCWNDFLADDLGSGLADLRRAPESDVAAEGELVAVCDRLLEPAVDWSTVPRTDLVHGDFRLANILFDDAGEVAGVIDIEAIGSGSRVFDYATLLDHPAIEPDALAMIIAAGSDVAGPEVLRACFARVALDLARFIRTRPETITVEHRSERVGQLTERARTIGRLTGGI